MINVEKKNLLGIDISALDYETAIRKIFECVREDHRCRVTALAVHGLVTGARDRFHRFRLNSFELVVPDGQPVRWALNLLYGTRLKDRVYGPKLSLLVCQEAARIGVPVYFYGSRQVVLDRLCRRLKELCPGLSIVGATPSKFRTISASERSEIVQEIKESGAQILFVGLGCPRQEVFVYELGDYLRIPILAVGAAFDYHSGILKEPPAYLQKMGLQWAFRLTQEPRRLWWRYLFTNSGFLILLMLQGLRLWRPTISKGDVPFNDVLYG